MTMLISDILDDVKLAGSFPDGMFADSDFVKFLNDSLTSDIIPFIMRHREGYFLTYTDYAAADTISIPTDAIAQKLGDVMFVDSSGNILNNVPRYTLEEISSNQSIGYGNNSTYGGKVGFYLEGNSIKFYPRNTNSDTVRIYYFKRPPFLTVLTNCALITDVTANDLTVESYPSTWTTATLIDVPSGDQPYTVATGPSISGIDPDASVITVSSATDIEAGQYLVPRGFSVYPQIPIELKDSLVQAAVVKALVSIKDLNGAKAAKELLVELMRNMSTLLSPRVEGEVKKIVNNSGIFNQRSKRLWR